MRAVANGSDRKGRTTGVIAVVVGSLLALFIIGGFAAFEVTREPVPTAIDRTHVVPTFDLPRAGSMIDRDALTKAKQLSRLLTLDIVQQQRLKRLRKLVEQMKR